MTAGGSALALTGTAGPAASAATGAAEDLGIPETTVGPTDPRYADLVRGNNLRYVGTPDYVRQVTSVDEIVRAVQAAVSSGTRLAVRSGGHCYENFVADPEVRSVIDLSQFDDVYYDPAMRAFAIEVGANLEKVYKTLYRGWGVTIPGGSCPSVGAGGHIAGGGYGILSRLHGLTVDHLYAVEVVVVGADGVARLVRATREPNDPHRDLWWAHTGGGGGNFGVVTRYWMRSHGASGDPSALLPAAPAGVVVANLSFSWDTMTEQGFTTMMRNYGSWLEENSAPDSPYARLFSQLKPQHRSAGSFALTAEIDATLPDADMLMDNFLGAVSAGVGSTPTVLQRGHEPWMHAVEWPGFTGGRDTTLRFKIKSAYLRQRFTDAQATAMYHHLTRTDFANPGALLLLTTYGGNINTVASDATVVPQRNSIMKPQFVVSWTDSSTDDQNIAWVRELYRDVFTDTGGVPVPNARTDGCYVNYADRDLSDPTWNTSGVPWSELYYKANYPALQRIKATWDPANVFRHDQSVELPG
ncbi:MAG TPA: FAD-binding protein [Pseudonocardiaceae bacterium]|nr:FAD-binding protein [Pseudonocardiaceae bacterium]